jgi:peptide/nickel transport system substrate-binding protein
MTQSQTELEQSKEEWQGFHEKIDRRVLSRRKVIKGSTALGLMASGGLGAFLSSCSFGDDDDDSSDGGSSSGGDGLTAETGRAPELGEITGDWDSTGTAPYRYGRPDSEAGIDPAWQKYPWTYKYGPWRYNWDTRVARGGHFIVPWGAPSNYDMMISGIASQVTNNKMYNAGLREGLNPLTASIEPDLALSAEHNADFTQWIFKVPGNAKFHDKPPLDGRLMTASDVVFSFERHIDTSLNKAALRSVTKVSAPDDTTVVFDLDSSSLNFPAILASPHQPVFAEEAFEDQDFFVQNPIGTGPYILEFSEFQNRADWVRNPEYWQSMPINQGKYGAGALPLTDKYTRQAFSNTVTAKEAFFAGQVDQFHPSCTLDLVLAREELERIPDALVITNGSWSCCPMGILFQYKNPLFQDKRVRQALSMSIDREQVFTTGLDSSGALGASPIPIDFQDKELPTPLSDFGENVQFNPKRAKELLIEAGYTEPLKLEVYQTATVTAVQAALDTVVFNWQENGIVDATKVVRDGQVFAEDTTNKSFPDLLFTGFGSLAFGYSLDASVAPPFLTDSPRNYGSLADPELDSLIEQWSGATDPAAAADLATQMSHRFVDEVDHIWFAWVGGIEIDQPWMHGATMSAHNCYHGIGWGNVKYGWLDETAPDGRGGTLV